MTFKNIVCPIDFSDSSAEAMRRAIELAKQGGGALTLLHVWHAPTYFYAEAPFPSKEASLIAAGAEKALAEWRQRAEALGAGKVAIRLLHGVAWDQIVSYLAQETAVDLVVIGTHGRSGLKHALLGSVAERVVRHAPCPVLVVRARA